MKPTHAGTTHAFRRVSARFLVVLGLCEMLLFHGAAPLSAALPQSNPPQSANDQPPTWDEAFHFLEHATFGPTEALVTRVQSIGFAAFLTEQFNEPLPSYPDLFNCRTDSGLCPSDQRTGCPASLPPDELRACDRDNYSLYPLQNRFFERALTAPDQLRHRVAFALNQIVVTSGQDPNLRLPQRTMPYLDVIERNAFGNYRSLLHDITLNPAMGRYLDTVDNRVGRPNENFAREILQLFSVGLNKLNPDGTPILDANGSRVPTYTQETINNFTRGFTGWVLDAQPEPGILNYFEPMVEGSPAFHDRTPKPLLNCTPDGQPIDDYYPCTVLPADQDAPTDLDALLTNILNYPGIAPYIGKNLIQHLVTSNPSPDYVQRVTDAFVTGTAYGFGTGQRGDLKAAIAAVLLDPEALNPAPAADFGHLKEPVLWTTNLLRGFNITPDLTDFVLGERFLGGVPLSLRMDQDVLYPPTVFNYFPQDYAIPGEESCGPSGDQPCLGPEFAIQSTQTSLARINFAWQVIYPGIPPNPDRPIGTQLDFSSLEPLAVGDAAALLDNLNARMLHGAMPDEMRAVVQSAVTNIPESDLTARVKEAVYLVATSSQYQVER